MPAHVLVLDAAEGIGPWARDALAHAGLACALVKENVEALRSVDAQWPALVVVPLDEVERWAPVLGRLGDGPTTVPVLGMASRDASVDVTPALALGVTDLLTYPCNGDDLVDRVTSSMRGRRSGRGPGPFRARLAPGPAPHRHRGRRGGAAAHRDGGGQGEPGRGARPPAPGQGLAVALAPGDPGHDDRERRGRRAGPRGPLAPGRLDHPRPDRRPRLAAPAGQGHGAGRAVPRHRDAGPARRPAGPARPAGAGRGRAAARARRHLRRHPGATGPGRPARRRRQGPPRAPRRLRLPPRPPRPPGALRRPDPRRGRHLGRPHPAPAPPPGHVRARRPGRAAPAGQPRPPARQADRRPRAAGDLGPAGHATGPRPVRAGRGRPPGGWRARGPGRPVLTALGDQTPPDRGHPSRPTAWPSRCSRG